MNPSDSSADRYPSGLRSESSSLDGSGFVPAAVALEPEPNSDKATPPTAAVGRTSFVRPTELRRVEDAKKLAKPLPSAHIKVVERWHGLVEEVCGDDMFIARLVSSGGVASLPEEIGEFPMALVSPDDVALVREGALFSYTVARETRGGTRRSVSILSFRRMPMWHLRQINDAKLEGERRAALLTERAGESGQQSFAATGS